MTRSLRVWRSSSARRVAPAVGRRQGDAADDGRHPDAAGADAAAAEPARRRSTEALKARERARIDEQTEHDAQGVRRPEADHRHASRATCACVREKLDDNNVRLGSLTQEVDALAAVGHCSCNVPRPAGRPVTVAAPPAPRPRAGAPAAPRRPRRRPSARHVARRSCVETAHGRLHGRPVRPRRPGFEAYIKTFPKSEQARRRAGLHRQRRICSAASTRRRSRRTTRAIRNYPTSSAVPEAYYKKGTALQSLKQHDDAREAFEYVVKNYPDSTAATLAQAAARQSRARAGRRKRVACDDVDDGELRMGSVNKVILVGNLGRDAELRYTPGGAAVATVQHGDDRGLERQGRPAAGKNRVAPHRALGQDRPSR